MSQNHLPTTVYEEAIRRLNFVFDNCDDIIVSMSGGKDSTVLYELTKRIARERGRLPLKVHWLDQEAEWQATADYMGNVMHSPEVEPFWWQIPFRLTNSLSFRNNYLHCWRPEDRERWLRPQDPISIKVNPTQFDRFGDLILWLPSHCDVAERKHVGVLVGLRIDESQNRRMTVGEHKARFKGITWCGNMKRNTRVFWPIYDFSSNDIWTAMAQNRWTYNTVYDQFYRLGVKDMRVSALIHETAWHNIRNLQEIEPGLYDRFVERVNGVNCFNQFREEIMPKALPPYFADWREYRDYLLENLIEPQHHELFRRRWARKYQQDDRWLKIHIREIMVNDIDGTISDNARTMFKYKDRVKDGGMYETAKRQRMAESEIIDDVE
jgi:predicted phosphoadenosine phosphosulfate sulfurtransferase